MTAFCEPADVDTWIDLPAPPAGNAGPGVSSSRCGHVLPASCAACDGVEAEEREMWAMPRRDRLALDLANLRCDPLWRELHNLPEHSDLEEIA